MMGHIWPIHGNHMDDELIPWKWYGVEFCKFLLLWKMYGVKAAVLSEYGQHIELKNVTLLGSNSDKRHAGLTQ